MVVIFGQLRKQRGQSCVVVLLGTVLKNEARTEAVYCVAEEKLGESVVIEDCICTHEHCYDTPVI